jgi:putative transposase
VVTTDSNHGRKVYPNLAGETTLTGTDQLWVADITYLRLQEEFIFLAVILDAYSHRDRVGAGLSHRRRPDSDGVTDGTGLPGRPARSGSPFRPRIAVRQQRLYRFAERARHRHQHVAQGEPMGQRACESFMKTLKYEEVFRNEYRDLAEAKRSIQRFLEIDLQRKAAAFGAGILPVGRV